MRRVFVGIILILLLIGMLVLAFSVKPVRASGTIYIRADGSIDPPDAPISTIDNVTYTFTGKIDGSIVVERDNIMCEGSGYTVQGSGAYDSNGIDLAGRNNVTIKHMTIDAFYRGINLYHSSSNCVSGNNITNNAWGVFFGFSSNNNVS